MQRIIFINHAIQPFSVEGINTVGRMFANGIRRSIRRGSDISIRVAVTCRYQEYDTRHYGQKDVFHLQTF
jgi:hypothetical protein